MKYERSCGVVVYTVRDGQRLYLVEHTPSGKYVLPKGHVEAGETEQETALREIREETNLEVALDCSFREIAVYSPKPNVEKAVVFFLTQPLTWDLIPQPGEVVSLAWLPFEEAEPIMTYPAIREVLIKAEACLKRRSE